VSSLDSQSNVTPAGLIRGPRVGTKVIAFVFSRKFSQNLLFVLAKDSLRKDKTFVKVFVKTKFWISQKLRGKITQWQILFICFTKNIWKELEQRENDVVLQQIQLG
jgi:hypothetical protein